jgi:SAM-dependent methyltransferase
MNVKKMTWEETILFIRKQPEYKSIVEMSYFDENLSSNVERFKCGDEFQETISLLNKFSNGGKELLDIGSGNGISAVAFALKGYNVMAIEPDPSETIGAGAIRKLKQHYALANLDVKEAFAEELKLPSESFDIVYARQCMHHAYNLEKFIGEIFRILRKGGILITVRDHVIFSNKDKEVFLKSHPLQKFYGGENAFTPEQYKQTMQKAGFTINLELKYYDSIINYFPLTKNEIDELPLTTEKKLKETLQKKIGNLANIPILFNLYKKRVGFISNQPPDERKIPGRMYSYVARKL